MLYLLRDWEQDNQGELARMLLAFGLKREYGIPELPRIERRKQGKPFFPEFPGICFNYSHCQKGVLCGIHTSEIGVDMERIVQYKERLARRICHPEELKLLELTARKDELMTRIWTCKESFLKYTGQGIRSDLRLLNCSGCAEGSFQLDKNRILSCLEMDFGFAVCCRGDYGDVVEVSGGELYRLSPI